MFKFLEKFFEKGLYYRIINRNDLRQYVDIIDRFEGDCLVLLLKDSLCESLAQVFEQENTLVVLPHGEDKFLLVCNMVSTRDCCYIFSEDHVFKNQKEVLKYDFSWNFIVCDFLFPYYERYENFKMIVDPGNDLASLTQAKVKYPELENLFENLLPQMTVLCGVLQTPVEIYYNAKVFGKPSHVRTYENSKARIDANIAKYKPRVDYINPTERNKIFAEKQKELALQKRLKEEEKQRLFEIEKNKEKQDQEGNESIVNNDSVELLNEMAFVKKVEESEDVLKDLEKRAIEVLDSTQETEEEKLGPYATFDQLRLDFHSGFISLYSLLKGFTTKQLAQWLYDLLQAKPLITNSKHSDLVRWILFLSGLGPKIKVKDSMEVEDESIFYNGHQDDLIGEVTLEKFLSGFFIDPKVLKDFVFNEANAYYLKFYSKPELSMKWGYRKKRLNLTSFMIYGANIVYVEYENFKIKSLYDIRHGIKLTEWDEKCLIMQPSLSKKKKLQAAYFVLHEFLHGARYKDFIKVTFGSHERKKIIKKTYWDFISQVKPKIFKHILFRNENLTQLYARYVLSEDPSSWIDSEMKCV